MLPLLSSMVPKARMVIFYTQHHSQVVLSRVLLFHIHSQLDRGKASQENTIATLMLDKGKMGSRKLMTMLLRVSSQRLFKWNAHYTYLFWFLLVASCTPYLHIKSMKIWSGCQNNIIIDYKLLLKIGNKPYRSVFCFTITLSRPKHL